MPTPFQPRQVDPSNRFAGAKPKLSTPQNPDWRCTRCDKMLGVCRDGRVHLRFARGHEYLVGYPVQATCRGCGTLNEASAPLR